MRMKKLISTITISAIAIAASALLITTGCKTTTSVTPSGTTNTVTVLDTNVTSRLAPILQTSVAGAVIYAYSKDANSVKYIAAIQTALNEFILSDDLSPSALTAKIYALPIKELKTTEAQLIITPILSAYKAFGQQYVKAGMTAQAGWKMLVQALVDGVNDGLTGVSQIQSQ